MKIEIFSVHDSKTAGWLQPFYSQTLDSGVRAFANICRDPEHSFGMNGGDYTLFHLGNFDQDTGEINKLLAPTNLGLALNYAHMGGKETTALRGIQGGE